MCCDGFGFFVSGGSFIHTSEPLHRTHSLLLIASLDWLIEFSEETDLIIVPMDERHRDEVVT